ncbi:MAG: sigma 54-interacting transcriptional regulator, partial [Desulfobacterales bacterium]
MKSAAPALPSGLTTIHCDQWLDILDQLNIGAFTVDLSHCITAMNFSARALMGLKGDSAEGYDCRDVFCDVPCHNACLLKDPQRRSTASAQVELPTDEDPHHLITRLASPMFDARGEVAGCLTVLQDHSPIADLINRVHYEARSLKIILDNLDIGVFTVNRGGLITFFNTAAEKISGYPRQEQLGRPCKELLGDPAGTDLELLNSAMADGRMRTHRQGRLIIRDGTPLPVRVHYLALRNEKGMIVGGLATFSDLTLMRRLDQVIRDRYTFQDMVGKDPAMEKIFDKVRVVAPTEATVLISGATGTGKDLLAKVIHAAGRRADKPFVKVNCAALPDNLLESEMFGYVKGAFTGAVGNKPGRFQEADGGAIFLDEIGDMPLALQAKLLRVIEDREFYPLGSRRTQRVNVRIIAASNQDLDRLVARKQFREDLFYRLNVMGIHLPPLKERRGDLPLLIRHIIRRLCAAQESGPPDISERAMEVLLNYAYPGNVREMENILEHALILS